MEHLLAAGATAPIRVPYYFPQPDEDGNIATVDDCKHLFEAAIQYYRSTGPYNEADVAYQRALWIEQCRDGRVYNLCHVLLNQFYFRRLYGILGPETVVADFTARDQDGTVYLSTANLESCLLAWKARTDELDKKDKELLLANCKLILEQAAIVLRHLAWFIDWSYATLPVRAAYPYDDNPLGNTHFACVVLHQALVQACVRVLGLVVDNGNPVLLRSTLPWLKKRMEREGWCPYTTRKLYDTCGVDELVYGYSLGTARTEMMDHDACTENVCKANNISGTSNDLEAVSVQHVNSACNCWIIEAPIDDIVAIMEQGSVPVLRISTDDGYKLSLQAFTANSDNDGGRYVAFSHVWVDGLGSPTSNTIRQCQLTRIADRLGRLEATESCGKLSIWIDTLCIPVAHGSQHLRDLAIQKMHQTYREAYAVMVMDADLWGLLLKPSIQELGMRLFLSAWASRLWTYQEGALNERLLIMTNDTFVDLDEIIKTTLQRSIEGDALQHNLIGAMSSKIILDFGRIKYEISSFGYTPEQELVWKLRHDSDGTAQTMIRALRDRSSSRGDEEAIIIGTFLDLDMESIFKANPKERMAALLKAMPFIPANIIFALGPRLRQPGLRWAPATFLRWKGGMAYEIIAEQVPKTIDRVWHHTTTVRPFSHLGAQDRGIWTYNAAVRLLRLFKPNDSGVSLAFELCNMAFSFTGTGEEDFDDMEKNAVHTRMIEDMLSQGRSLAILVPDFIPTKQLYVGVLVEITNECIDEAGYRGGKQARYIVPVNVSGGNHLGSDLLENMRKGEEEADGTTVPNTLPDGHNKDHYRATLVQGYSSDHYRANWIDPRFWLVD